MTAIGEATTSASSGNAKNIVGKSCITCHAEQIQGGAGPALDKIGSKYDQKEIENIINKCKNGMPAGVISCDDVVAEWLAQKY